MKFKVGDRVRSIHNKEEYYVVSEGSSSSYIRCRNEKNAEMFTTEEHLELVENTVNVYEQWADYNDFNKESKQDTVDRLKKELEEAEKALDKPPVVNGYELKILESEIGCNTIGFGCAKIHSDFFTDINFLNSDMETASSLICNRSIKSITLNSGVEISIEQCKEIKEYFNKNK